MTKNVLITRPYPQAQEAIDKIREMGLTPIVSPLITIEFLPLQQLPTPMPTHIILTSQNAVPALQGLPKALPVICVGSQTADKVTRAGHTHVIDINGTSDDLLRYINETYPPSDGSFLYLRGNVIHQDISKILQQAGYRAVEEIVYTSTPQTQLTAEVMTLLRQGNLPFCLFFSRKTAEVFGETIIKQGAAQLLVHTTAMCLSPTIARPLQSLPWQKIAVSPAPTPKDFWVFAEKTFFFYN